jgi:hypothetical protein
MFWKYSVSWVVIFVTFWVLLGTGYADPVDVDFSQVKGICLDGTSDQYRIDNIHIQYTDPSTGQRLSSFCNVIFQWNPEQYVLIPFALAGIQNGQLRVQISNSVTGWPIEGVEVSVLGQSIFTDDDGIVRFSALPDQKVSVLISQTGYENLSMDVDIPSDGSTKKLAVQIMPIL